MISEEFKKFKFPTWKEFSAQNQKYIDKEEYTGYHIEIPVNNKQLYMFIECQNQECIKMGSNVIRFSWCNRAGFAVSSSTYMYDEAGYIAGCVDLINFANDASKIFKSFIERNTHIIRTRIKEYEEEHKSDKDN